MYFSSFSLLNAALTRSGDRLTFRTGILIPLFFWYLIGIWVFTFPWTTNRPPIVRAPRSHAPRPLLSPPWRPWFIRNNYTVIFTNFIFSYKCLLSNYGMLMFNVLSRHLAVFIVVSLPPGSGPKTPQNSLFRFCV